MRKDAIQHCAFDAMCYPLDDETLEITLKTGKDIDAVEMVAGDPFTSGIMGSGAGWNGEEHAVDRVLELENHLLWRFRIRPEFRRLKYYFKIHCGDETAVLGESGFTTMDEVAAGRYYEFYIFPWMNGADIKKVPQWPKSCVWYQIFPSRFARGNNPADTAEHLPWGKLGQEVSWHDSFGGNLRGITDRLDYLRNLGIGGIYMTPVNLSRTQHKYDTDDYLTIDPSFGTNADMAEMVRQCHRRGIRVMLDGVFNHCGPGFFAWKDVLEKKQDSRYRDWFFINDFDFKENESNTRAGRYYSFAFVDKMPKLNTNNPEVREYFIGVCKKWIADYDIDGLRLDVANEISHRFCRELNAALKSVKSDFYIVGEIWHNSLPWLRENEFDAVMNYPVENSVADFFADTRRTAKDLEWALNRCCSMYFRQINEILFNQMDSHDTIRIRNRLGSLEKAEQAESLLFSLAGSVCIYYGTEIMLEGGHDPDNRRCMPWKEIDEGLFEDEREFYRNLIALRKNSPALMGTELEFVYDSIFTPDSRLVHIKKTCGLETVHVYINASSSAVELDCTRNLLSRRYEKGKLMPEGVLFAGD